MDLVAQPPEDPGPGARVHTDALAASLALGPAFRVVGLVEPVIEPAVLAEIGTVDDAWQRVVLSHGNRDAADGPYVVVVCEPAGLVAGELPDLLEAEWTRLPGQSQDAGPGPAPAPEHPTTLVVDSSPIAARVCGDRRIWVARAPLDPFVTVTLIARGVDRYGVRIATVTDLEPMLRTREISLAKLRTKPGNLPPEQLDFPPARGLEGHEDLIRLCLGHGDTVRTSASRRALLPHTDAAIYRRAWEIATRAQMRFAGQGRAEAVAAVTAMVNQAGTLAEKAGWFGEQGLRDRAIAEIARHTAFDSDVRSRDAQQVWRQAWAARSAPARDPDHEHSREWFMDVAATEAVFLTAWQHWADAAG